MTTLTPGGQRLAEALFERGLLYRTEIGAYLAHPMGRDVRPDLNAAATTLALDAPPAGGDGGLREAFEDAALARDEAGFAGTPAQCIRYLDAEVTRLAALARPDPREQAAAGVGEKSAKELTRELRDIIMADIRAASGSNAFPGEPVGVSARHLSIILTARLGCHFAALTQPNQTPEAAAPSGSVGDAALPPKWLADQLESAGSAAANWSPGVRASFEATHGPIPQPAPQAPVADAAGVGRIPFQTLQAEPTPPEEAKRLLVQHAKNALADVLLKYAPQFDYNNAAMADALFEAGALVDAALTPPQAARPGDGVHKLSTFSAALDLMKIGDACFRTAWKPGKSIRIVNPDKPALSYLALLYEDGRQAPWTPTRCDLLEEDWTVLGPTPVQADAAEGRS